LKGLVRAAIKDGAEHTVQNIKRLVEKDNVKVASNLV
jgi:hypothetical protein